eukprot:ANDGO_08586.mRNA.1 hypothetical protein
MTVLTQAQLAVEFGLIPNESAMAQFRFRDFKRNILDRADAAQLKLFCDDPAHGIVTQRLPHRMSRRSFAFRLLMAVFHVTIKTGHIPLFWKAVDQSLVYHMLPDCAKSFLPEVAIIYYERSASALGSSAPILDRIEWSRRQYEESAANPNDESAANPNDESLTVKRDIPSTSPIPSPENTLASLVVSLADTKKGGELAGGIVLP